MLREYAGVDCEGKRLYVDDVVIMYGAPRLFTIVGYEEIEEDHYFLELTELESFDQDGQWSEFVTFYTPEKLMQLRMES